MTYFDMSLYKEDEIKDKENKAYYTGYKHAVEDLESLSNIDNFGLDELLDLNLDEMPAVQAYIRDIAKYTLKMAFRDVNGNRQDLLIGILDKEEVEEENKKNGK